MRLTVPAPEKKALNQAIINPIGLDEWLDQLPHVDLESRIDYISHALNRLNRYPASVEKFQQLLERYQDAFDDAFELFNISREYFIEDKGRFKSHHLLNSFLEFNRELTFAYNRLLNEQQDNMQSELLLPLIRRAMQSHEMDILFCYEHYKNIPPTSRQSLYQLYILAEQQGIASSKKSSTDSSPQEIIIRIVLLTQLDPYSLPRQGIWAAKDYLKMHSRLTTFNESSAKGLQVDIRGASPARQIEGQPEPPADPQRYRYIDTTLLCEATKRHINQTIDDITKLPDCLRQLDQSTALQLMQRWILSWSSQKNRQDERQPKYHRIKTACGLEDIHFFINQGCFKTHIEHQANDNELIMNDEHDFLSSETLMDHPVFEWQLFDLSKSGAGLTEESENTSLFDIGQIVLIGTDRPDSKQPNWKTGIIRRKLEDGSNKCEIGIQFIQGKLHPLQVKPLITEAADPCDFSCAFLVNNNDGRPLLLTQPSLFRPKREIDIKNEGKIRRVAAKQLVESSLYFDLFSFVTDY